MRVPGGWASQISRQSARKGGKVVSPATARKETPNTSKAYKPHGPNILCLLTALSRVKFCGWKANEWLRSTGLITVIGVSEWHFIYHKIYVHFVNPLNAELNPIHHLLAMVGARHIVHVSMMRFKGKTPTTEVESVDWLLELWYSSADHGTEEDFWRDVNMWWLWSWWWWWCWWWQTTPNISTVQ